MAKLNRAVEYITLPSRDRWMVTFSDMTNLLLTFFVLIIATSSMDTKVFKESFGFFNQGDGVLEFPAEQKLRSVPRIKEASVLKIYVDAAALSRDVMLQLPTEVARGTAGAAISAFDIRETPRGLAISLDSNVLFDPGSAQLKPQAATVLAALAVVLAKTDYQLSVEGHTDNTGGMESNMTLSLKRAQAVLDHFVYVNDLTPTRFCLAGYGPLVPRAANASEYGRARNRRVEVVLLKDQV